MAKYRQKRVQDEIQQAQSPITALTTGLFTALEMDVTGPGAKNRTNNDTPNLDRQSQQASGNSGFNFGHISLFATSSARAVPRSPHQLILQPQLNVGPVGDKYEQEADHVAAQVVDTINQSQGDAPVQREDDPDGASVQRQPVVSIQRMDASEADEMQRQPLMDIQHMRTEEDNDVQRKAAGEPIGAEGGAVSPQLASQIQAAKRCGQSLDRGLQRRMGQAMGADFSGVKVHTDAQSDQLNDSIQAKAFTTGSDVFFKQGAYHPSSRGGQELIAHELTHVVQQSGAAQGIQRQKHGVIQRDTNRSLEPVTTSAVAKLTPQEAEEQMSVPNLGTATVNANIENVEPTQKLAMPKHLEKYAKLYESADIQYFELQNNEISDYFKAIYYKTKNPEFLSMTSEQLVAKHPNVINESLVPHHWASGFEPGWLSAGEGKLGHLTPVFYPENLPKRGGKVYRGDGRAPWDETMKGGVTSWARSKGETQYSKDILRHIVPLNSPTDSAYVSTSFDKNIINKFSGFRYYMTIPEGGIDIDKNFITAFSQSNNEQELAIPYVVPFKNVFNVSKGNQTGLPKKYRRQVIKDGLWFEPVRNLWSDWPGTGTGSQYDDGYTWADHLRKLGSLEEQIAEAVASENQSRLESTEEYEQAYIDYGNELLEQEKKEKRQKEKKELAQKLAAIPQVEEGTQSHILELIILLKKLPNLIKKGEKGKKITSGTLGNKLEKEIHSRFNKVTLPVAANQTETVELEVNTFQENKDKYKKEKAALSELINTWWSNYYYLEHYSIE